MAVTNRERRDTMAFPSARCREVFRRRHGLGSVEPPFVLRRRSCSGGRTVKNFGLVRVNKTDDRWGRRGMAAGTQHDKLKRESCDDDRSHHDPPFISVYIRGFLNAEV